jgi:DNA polymerase-1
MHIDNIEEAIFLIDGSSFLYRAYYGVRPLHTPQGVPVHAVFIFCRMIKKLIDQFNPRFIAIVWDSKGKTTRHTLYEAYKATRKAAPADIFEQKEYIMRFADLIGIKQIAQQGIEADDIMYSIVKEQKEHTQTIVMITSDKDMSQVLDNKTIIYDPLKDIYLTNTLVEKKNGFPIHKLPLYYALVGDASDNIPGVRGIGNKGATELAKQFESLEQLYANLDTIKSKRIKMALQASKDKAFLSKELFLLQYHCSGIEKKDMFFDAANWNLALPFFEELNFKSLLATVQKKHREQPKIVTQYDFKLITNKHEYAQLHQALSAADSFALDTETDGLNPLEDTCVGISISIQEGQAWYIPFGHKTAQEQLEQSYVIAQLKPILESAHYKKYFHNAKFDVLVLHMLGINIQGIAFDTMIAARLVVREWQRIGLKELSEHYFHEPMISFKEVVTDAGYKNFAQVPLERAVHYAAADAHQTLKLVPVLQAALERELQKNLYNTIEHPLIEVLCSMEYDGIQLDIDMLAKLNTIVSKELTILEYKIHDTLEGKHTLVNINSPRQIEQLLFYDLGLQPQKKNSKSSHYSTDQKVLESLSGMHPVVNLIIRYRELFKLKNTYIDALPTYVNTRTGKLHTTYSQIAVATGRLASSHPNLQNIPADSAGYGIEIRAAFKPNPGQLFLSADYSQIELRILAFLSQDKQLTKAFLDGADIHKETAARLFEIPIELVDHHQRQIGKRINFSILYGLTPYGLSQDLKIPLKQAKLYIERYFVQYPGVCQWMESIIEQAKINGYVSTYWGRRRYVPGIYEQNATLYKEATRIAINTVAQGTAAEIMKMGMINVHKAFKTNNIQAHIVLQIHDELLISADKNNIIEIEALTKKILESIVDWQIPLLVTTRIGSDWKEVTK